MKFIQKTGPSKLNKITMAIWNVLKRLIKDGALIAIIGGIVIAAFYYARGYDSSPHRFVIGNHSFKYMNIVENGTMHKYLQDTDVEIQLSTIKLNHNTYNLTTNSIKTNTDNSVITCNATTVNQVSRDEKTYHDVRITITADSIFRSLTVTDLKTNIIKIYK